MIFQGNFKGLAVGERRVDADLVTQWLEMMLDVSDNDFIRAGVIVIESYTDVDVRWIAAKEIGLAWKTVTINQQQITPQFNYFFWGLSMEIGI